MEHAVDLRTLRSFVTVAREGNVSRAAVILHLTQPAISLQLKRLTESTGLTLFVRTAKGLDLTQDGSALLVKAEQVLAALEDFRQTARRIKGTVRGTLRVGTVIDPNFIRLGQFLQAIITSAPELRTQLSHGMSGDVPTRLLRGDIDVGYFLGDPADGPWTATQEKDRAEPVFRHSVLTKFNYRVVAPAGWKNRTAGLDLEGLATLPWIGTPAASVHRRLLDRRFKELDVMQNVVTVVDQESSMLAMARSGVGLCLCRESMALNEEQVHGLVVVEGASVETTLGFLSLESRRNEPGVELAFDLVANIWCIQ